MLTISVLVKPLKDAQRAVGALLQALFTSSDAATGFIAGHSVACNARHHLHKNCMLNMDFENFFPSITKNMVRTALRQELADRITSSEVINMICNLYTVPDGAGVEVLP